MAKFEVGDLVKHPNHSPVEVIDIDHMDGWIKVQFGRNRQCWIPSTNYTLVTKKEEKKMTAKKAPVTKTKTLYIAVCTEEYDGRPAEEFDTVDEAKEKIEDWISDGIDADTCKVYEVVKQLKRKVIWE